MFIVRKIVPIAVLSYVLNLAWEMSQAFLFAPHFSGAVDFIFIHVVVAFTDVMLTLLILSPEFFLFDRIFRKGDEWKRIVLTASLGFLIAVGIERYALSTGMWAYGSFMPILPILGVGLTPVLQMAVLPIFVFFAAKSKVRV
ncbi:MAG: hypothetical protein WCJ25_03895 [Candidatus Moraniibacteriota bacterium]